MAALFVEVHKKFSPKHDRAPFGMPNGLIDNLVAERTRQPHLAMKPGALGLALGPQTADCSLVVFMFGIHVFLAIAVASDMPHETKRAVVKKFFSGKRHSCNSLPAY